MKKNKNNYKVLITTSGIGSRLNEITKDLNKALIEVGGSPVLSRIIEMYPQDIPFVITLGYLSEQVVNYLTQYHPDRTFEYVTVDKYEGPGTSCGYSMLQAESKLQCPFIFHACDTIVFEPIPAPNYNWTAGYVNSHIPEDVVEKNFTTHLIKEDKLAQVNPLGAKEYSYIHIGITAIKDYRAYWDSMRRLYNEDVYGSKFTDLHAINDMISHGFTFSAVPFKIWLDTGNPNTLAYTNDYFKINKTNGSRKTFRKYKK